MKRTLIAAGFALLTTPVYAQPPSAEAIIADNDRNGDKGLSKEEWSPQAPIGYPEDADTNKDNRIDAGELQALSDKGPPQ